MKIAILGATGKTGRYLVAELCELGHAVTAIGRSGVRLARLDPRARHVVADLERIGAIAGALEGVEAVVSLAHARHTGAVLEALPKSCRRVVLTGSTRRFTTLPDAAGDEVRTAEEAFLAAGRAGVMLHPSMIYGAPDERNVNRILRYLRRWPKWLPALVPLPAGGQRTVQPVFVDDVVAAFVGALTRPSAPGAPVIVAGPEPMRYAEMIQTCARALGRRAVIVPLPLWLGIGAARVLRLLGLRGVPKPAELRRTGEDKAFDVGPLEQRLGVRPRAFAEGLRLKIERGWY
ncbi:MAG: SDR family oxidoreductase [Alphaproteobacteria bacterium]